MFSKPGQNQNITSTTFVKLIKMSNIVVVETICVSGLPAVIVAIVLALDTNYYNRPGTQ